MINVMNPSKESMNEVESCLDRQLWHSCAGGMVQMPEINSKVLYFPQGHIEHAQVNSIDLKNYPKIPPLIPCRISGIKYLANQENDEVYAKIRLVPLRGNDFDDEDGFIGSNYEMEGSEKPASFAKTLTQSDANNGGGFSVPRYCAETIFPRLDYSAEPPVQTILAKDVHGVTWKFRHIYRGTPRRHLLTTGWSNFVNQKKLVAGDSIVFLRADNGDLFVGIRRPKREILHCGGSSYGGGFGAFLRSDENRLARNFEGMGSNSGNNEKVRAESVVEAANLAASGKAFEVVYYPRASTPEFFVKTGAVRAAMQVQWCAGMRFKMAFETEDSSRISWFMGNISSVQVVDPIHWPNSPWRLLQVAWDEPDLLQNVKRVNPWSVESVTNMPQIHISPFSPPRKKLRLHQVPEIPFADQLPMPAFTSRAYGPSGSLFGLAEVPAGVQGARHAHFRQFLSDHINKVNYSSLLSNGPELKYHHGGFSAKKPIVRENLSSFLTMATLQESPKENDMPTPKFMLFGKPILTKQQISESSSSDSARTASDSNADRMGNSSDDCNDTSLNKSSSEGFPCKVFMDSEDVGRTLSLSALGSCDGMYKKIAQHVWQGKVLEAEQCAL
ncbi:auxin response factor 18-like [Chenopodium quinoa]|uniref:Auxin response factor n=1 Tax=Chenopodium quinoa TaxID=63459 RepID=A0A803LSQ4_CHEQI|nr:auxin response factor 18-like [Chenopodium quinoa]XP_021771038.1 auxin response factor 18-like [Chenopodium quinoa]